MVLVLFKYVLHERGRVLKYCCYAPFVSLRIEIGVFEHVSLAMLFSWPEYQWY